MKSFILSCFLMGATLGLLPPQPKSIATECGQTLYVTESASIEYKVGQFVNMNEVCPWTIRYESAASLRFELLSSGFDHYDKLVVATLDAEQIYPLSTVMSESIILGENADSVTLDGRIAIVVFSSLLNTGTGFYLKITRVGESTTTVSPSSVDRISAGNSGQWTHAPEGSNYANFELSTFIAAPLNYTFNLHGVGATRLRFTERGLQGRCSDSVDIWSFDRAQVGEWQHSRRICGGDGAQDLPNLQDLALVTFVSDDDVVGEGFMVEYYSPNNVRLQ